LGKTGVQKQDINALGRRAFIKMSEAHKKLGGGDEGTKKEAWRETKRVWESGQKVARGRKLSDGGGPVILHAVVLGHDGGDRNQTTHLSFCSLASPPTRDEKREMPLPLVVANISLRR